jgi:hypothetical protein
MWSEFYLEVLPAVADVGETSEALEVQLKLVVGAASFATVGVAVIVLGVLEMG